MQDHRFFTGLKDDRLQRDAWNREFALDKWRKQADAPPVVRRRGYPNRAANIAEKKYERYVDEMVSGPTSEKQIRKIRAKIEMERRGAANRRRRMQGSMGDDL